MADGTPVRDIRPMQAGNRRRWDRYHVEKAAEVLKTLGAQFGYRVIEPPDKSLVKTDEGGAES